MNETTILIAMLTIVAAGAAVLWIVLDEIKAICRRLSELEKFKKTTVDKWLLDRPPRSVFRDGARDTAPDIVMSPEAREYIIQINVNSGLSRDAAEKLFEMNYGPKTAPVTP